MALSQLNTPVIVFILVSLRLGNYQRSAPAMIFFVLKQEKSTLLPSDQGTVSLAILYICKVKAQKNYKLERTRPMWRMNFKSHAVLQEKKINQKPKTVGWSFQIPQHLDEAIQDYLSLLFWVYFDDDMNRPSAVEFSPTLLCDTSMETQEQLSPAGGIGLHYPKSI